MIPNRTHEAHFPIAKFNFYKACVTDILFIQCTFLMLQCKMITSKI